MSEEFMPTKLLWMDLEMTGLDTAQHVIVEVAAEITDFNFKTLASYEAVIAHPGNVLDKVDDWSREQHALSGLTERINTEGRDEKEVIHELVGFISAQFAGEPATLAGNSIHNDRRFIRTYWPEVEQLLHYRMFDVSSFKILMQAKYGVVFEKNKAHRAFDDIQASIAELQHYLEFFNKKSS
jgi:oligoribonuclease